MTDLTDQLDAIQKRADVVRRCMDAAPNDSYDMGDINKALEAQRGDVPFLLVLARKQQAAIDAVRVLVHDDTLADGLVMHAVNPEAIREALEAKP